MLYLNYVALENGKTHHVLLIISLIIFLLYYITHRLKELRTLDKKLNDKKSNEIKKFYWKRDVFKPSKAKKNQLFTRRMILYLFQKSETQHFNILSISWDSFGFLEFDINISIKRKLVSEDCPKCCPCCGVSVPNFSH